jgi:hypothetical protein
MNSLRPDGRRLCRTRAVTARLLLALALALTYCLLTEHRRESRAVPTTSEPKLETFHGKEAPKGNRK